MIYKISKLSNIPSYLILIPSSLLSMIFLDFIFKTDRLLNYFILLLVILSFPLASIYQKYFDPLIYLILFGLINSDYLKELFQSGFVKIKFLYLYFSSFLIFSIIYYY